MATALEQSLWDALVAAGLPLPEREVTFLPPRKYRADFLWPCGLVVECDGLGGGGAGGAGGHQTLGGIQSDHERDALANSSIGGQWHITRVDRQMVKSGLALAVIEDQLALRGAVPMRPENQALLRRLLKMESKPKVQRVPKPRGARTTKPKPNGSAEQRRAAPGSTQTPTGTSAKDVTRNAEVLGVDLCMFSPEAVERTRQWVKEAPDLMAQPPAVQRAAVLQEAQSQERKLR